MSTLIKIYGIHAVTAMLQHSAKQVVSLLVNRESKHHAGLNTIVEHARLHKIKIDFAARDQLDRESEHNVHQGVIALCKPLLPKNEGDLEFFLDALKHPPVFLILDQVQDPHNLGACFRSANALGADAVIVPKNNSAPLTGAVYKTASGALLLTPFFQVTNLVRTMEMLKTNNVWVFGLDAEAKKNIYENVFDSAQGIALVLGAEGAGLRRLTREHCDELLYIPMKGNVSSLNVSVAAGIVMAEVMRQRGL